MNDKIMMWVIKKIIIVTNNLVNYVKINYVSNIWIIMWKIMQIIICLMGIIMWLMGTINNLNSNDVKK